MRHLFRRSVMSGMLVAALLLAGGCVLAPKEAKDEQARLDDAGVVYKPPFEKRPLPELPSEPS